MDANQIGRRPGAGRGPSASTDILFAASGRCRDEIGRMRLSWLTAVAGSFDSGLRGNNSVANIRISNESAHVADGVCKTGLVSVTKYAKPLDSGFRRNDGLSEGALATCHLAKGARS